MNGKSQMTANTASQLVTDLEDAKKLLEIEQWSHQSSLEELHLSYAEALQKQMSDELANGLAEFVEVETVAEVLRGMLSAVVRNQCPG